VRGGLADGDGATESVVDAADGDGAVEVGAELVAAVSAEELLALPFPLLPAPAAAITTTATPAVIQKPVRWDSFFFGLGPAGGGVNPGGGGGVFGSCGVCSVMPVVLLG
jgi:hypothetical protein